MRYRCLCRGGRFVAIILSGTILTSCMTPYQSQGFSGGYKDFELNKNTYVVSFGGNGFTPEGVVQGYVLRRAAELTLQKGYKYFLVLNGRTGARDDLIQTPTTVNTHSNGYYNGNVYGNYYSGYGSGSSYTTINPGSTYDVKHYNASATIKMLRSSSGYSNAYNAAIILSNYKNKR